MTFILKLMEITFESIKSNYLCNTWDIKFFDFTSKFCFRVFNNNANSSVKLFTVKWFCNANLQWSWSLFFWNFFKSPAKNNRAVFFSEQLFFLIIRMLTLEIFLECFYACRNLLLIDILFHLWIYFFHFTFHYFLVFFF